MAGPRGRDGAPRRGLDSLGKPKEEAARRTSEFAAAYPKDKRAADAQYNAAVTYPKRGDNATAARAYGSFAARFPRDPRAAQRQATARRAAAGGGRYVGGGDSSWRGCAAATRQRHEGSARRRQVIANSGTVQRCSLAIALNA